MKRIISIAWKCEQCNGYGSFTRVREGKTVTCRVCNGTGYERHERWTEKQYNEWKGKNKEVMSYIVYDDDMA